MLGWVLKRGLEGGRDATDGADDTQIDQPDTPGPIFAARAFKSALFGTPAPPERDSTNDNKPKDSTPPRRLPGGILLTPGTGTTRRKRVSFGHDVEETKSNDNQPALDKSNNANPLKKELRVDRTRRTNLFDKPARAGSTSTTTSDSDRNQIRSKVAEAPENARTNTGKESEPKPAQVQQQQELPQLEETDNAREEIWEEEDDDEGGNWDPDVTVDLNEPHSQSGRFWKAQFQCYQEDAKMEMSRLLKYKQLAKSYAKMKDAEARDMQAKLQEEKEKVTKMEERITELAGKIASKRMNGSDNDYQELISDLTRQTALAVQYRNQVKELEAMLQDDDGPDAADDDSVLTARSRRLLRRQAAGGAGTIAALTAVSPRTQRTLNETQRELRRAREQVRELTQARDEARRLRTALRAAETRALQSEREAKGLRAELEAAKAAVQDQAKRAEFAEDERRHADDELRRLQRKYETLKDDAKARVGEAEQVLRRKNDEIAQWKKIAATAQKGFDAAGTETRVSAAPKTGDDHPPAGLAALEKLTRTRYEALSRRRQSSGAATTTTAAGRPVLGEKPTADDDVAFRLNNLRFEPDDEPPVAAAAEPELPPLKKRIVPAKRPSTVLATKAEPAAATFRILEDDDSTFYQQALAPLSQKDMGQPLRTIPEPQQRVRPSTTVARTFSKPAVTTTTTTTTDAMDVSRCSLASERAAAAVARIEKRRAERKQKLDELRNKENLQPA